MGILNSFYFFWYKKIGIPNLFFLNIEFPIFLRQNSSIRIPIFVTRNMLVISREVKSQNDIQGDKVASWQHKHLYQNYSQSNVKDLQRLVNPREEVEINTKASSFLGNIECYNIFVKTAL